MRILLACCLGLMAGSALAQTTDSPLTTQSHMEEGEYITDGNGMSLYLFEADTQGTGGADARSACQGDCLAAWPPLVVEEMPVGDPTVDASLLGTLTRSDGTLQATYNGWPLYYYAEDAAPGDIRGHDIEEFGEEWYLVSPGGTRADDDDDDDD
jgi:predicted lipoprotein with Yx(FWY)xxD motif